jgi:TIR domain-containing protein
MRVFISWSLPRSRAVAQVLRTFLPKVIQVLDPFMSATDIDGGQRWFHEIGERLEECDVGVCVVTSDNHARPWLNFEAGALSKSMKLGRVIPFLFDVSERDLVGPLAQFQNRGADEDGIRGLLTDLNSLMPEYPLDDERLNHSIDLHLPLIFQAFEAIKTDPNLGPPAPPSTRGTPEVLDEILRLVRSMQAGPTVLAGGVDTMTIRSTSSTNPDPPSVESPKRGE